MFSRSRHRHRRPFEYLANDNLPTYHVPAPDFEFLPPPPPPHPRVFHPPPPPPPSFQSHYVYAGPYSTSAPPPPPPPLPFYDPREEEEDYITLVIEDGNEFPRTLEFGYNVGAIDHGEVLVSGVRKDAERNLHVERGKGLLELWYKGRLLERDDFALADYRIRSGDKIIVRFLDEKERDERSYRAAPSSDLDFEIDDVTSRLSDSRLSDSLREGWHSRDFEADQYAHDRKERPWEAKQRHYDAAIPEPNYVSSRTQRRRFQEAPIEPAFDRQADERTGEEARRRWEREQRIREHEREQRTKQYEREQRRKDHGRGRQAEINRRDEPALDSRHVVAEPEMKEMETRLRPRYESKPRERSRHRSDASREPEDNANRRSKTKEEISAEEYRRHFSKSQHRSDGAEDSGSSLASSPDIDTSSESSYNHSQTSAGPRPKSRYSHRAYSHSSQLPTDAPPPPPPPPKPVDRSWADLDDPKPIRPSYHEKTGDIIAYYQAKVKDEFYARAEKFINSTLNNPDHEIQELKQNTQWVNYHRKLSEGIMACLLKLDGVSLDGDEDLRKRRKEAVDEMNEQLQKLDDLKSKILGRKC